jgi:hypothetical protein
MTQSVYKGIRGRPDLPWLCSSCIVKSLESLKQTKSIEDRCADYKQMCFAQRLPGRRHLEYGRCFACQKYCLSLLLDIMV